MSPVSRRRFLIGSLVGAGITGAAVVAVATYAGVFIPPNERLAHLIRIRLPYLIIPDETMNAFVRDSKTYTQRQPSLRTLALSAAYRSPLGYGTLRRKLPYPLYEQNAITTFLLSTDFFQEGADVTRPLRYVSYADPYLKGCANPLARIGA